MSDLPFHRFLPGRSERSRDLIINIAYLPEMHKGAGRIPEEGARKAGRVN